MEEYFVALFTAVYGAEWRTNLDELNYVSPCLSAYMTVEPMGFESTFRAATTIMGGLFHYPEARGEKHVSFGPTRCVNSLGAQREY